MNQPQLKPQYLAVTEEYTVMAGLVWCAISVGVGVTFIGIAVGIAIPFMTFLMLFIGKWMIKFLLFVQKANPIISRKQFDFVILFFWASGILGFLCILMQGGFGHPAEAADTYFYIAASIFPLGVSLGAAEKWEQRFCYE